MGAELGPEGDRPCLCVFVGFELLIDANHCQASPAGTGVGTGPGPSTLRAGIRAKEDLDLGQDGGASHLPGRQGAGIKLLHSERQVGRVGSGSGPLSGRSWRHAKKTIGLHRLEEVARSFGGQGEYISMISAFPHKLLTPARGPVTIYPRGARWRLSGHLSGI